MARRSRERAQREHAGRRFSSRLGINLTPANHAALVAMIQSNKLTPVRRTSNRCTVFEATLSELPGADDIQLGIDPGEKVRIVYDKNRKQVVTVLPGGEE